MGSKVTEGEDGSFHGPFVQSDERDRFRAAAVLMEHGGEEHLNWEQPSPFTGAGTIGESIEMDSAEKPPFKRQVKMQSRFTDPIRTRARPHQKLAELCSRDAISPPHPICEQGHRIKSHCGKQWVFSGIQL